MEKCFEKIIEDIPKCELHLHLRGAISNNTILSVINRNKEKVLLKNDFLSRFAKIEKFNYILTKQKHTLLDIDTLMRFENFEDFINTYSFIGWFIMELADFEELLNDLIEYLKKCNIVYSEVTVTLGDYIRNGIDLELLLKKLELYGEEYNIKWILDPVRTYGADYAAKLLDEIDKHNSRVFSGITLGGLEYNGELDNFKNVFAKAKRKGMKLTIHAGETGNSSDIWEAINNIDLDRIGHGIAAYGDIELQNYLKEKNIPLEICITSNICTKVVCDVSSHPVRNFIYDQIPITISSDDPTFFKTTLNNEYLLLVNTFGITISRVIDIIENGFKYSFLSDENKENYIKQIRKSISTL